MKRYRVLQVDFDSRASLLNMEIKDEWDEAVKEIHHHNKRQTKEYLLRQYGSANPEMVFNNLIDLGDKPMSIVAFHNKFFEQIRKAFIVGAYYPALTGTSALGERILNHLLLKLKRYFTNTPEYKRIYDKHSIDNWELLLSILERWKVLLPETVIEYTKLLKIRNASIHFRQNVDTQDREIALNAIQRLQKVISFQFSGFGNQPWFMISIPGEIYIKKEWENVPFIKEIYLPNCVLVGPYHNIVSILPKIIIKDESSYEKRDITDKEFIKLRIKAKT
jgi:hypothetical protein